MNQYSSWKYILILLTIGLSLLYVTPNFYGESFASTRQRSACMYKYEYCDGIIDVFRLSDGTSCSSKGTYYEVYVFWNEDNRSLVKKIDKDFDPSIGCSIKWKED